MLEIKDSVAVIIGGASGIGLTFAKYWAQNGGKIVLGDVAGDVFFIHGGLRLGSKG